MVMPVGFLQDRLQRGRVATPAGGLRAIQVAVDVDDGHATPRGLAIPIATSQGIIRIARVRLLPERALVAVKDRL
jgi:hypothetical protein